MVTVVYPLDERIKESLKRKDYSRLNKIILKEAKSCCKCEAILDYLRENFNPEFPKESWKHSIKRGIYRTINYLCEKQIKRLIITSLKIRRYELNIKDMADFFNEN